MPGGLFTIEIAKSGLFANQRGLDVTGQNIANASNDDYHKQRVIMESTSPLYPLGFPGATVARQIGTGVDVKMIERVRDIFLERRLQKETESLGKYDKAYDYLHQVELIYNEPSENSLRSRADAFWSALQDLANNPEDISIRAVVRETALGLTEIIRQQAADFNQLGGETLNTSLNEEIKAIVEQMNSAGKELAQLNKHIQVQEAAGHNPNDLLDKRDAIIKDMSQYADIRVGESVLITDTNSTNHLVTVGGITLAHGTSYSEFETRFKSDGKLGIFVKGTRTEVSPGNGELKALYDFRDLQLPQHMKGLSDFAMTLTEMMNDIHRNGFGLDGSTNVDFFQRFETQSSGIYKITGENYVSNPELALNGGMYGTETVRDIRGTLNSSPNFDGSLIGNMATNAVTGELKFNDINDSADATSPATVNYNVDTDTLESIVDRINLNVYGSLTYNMDRTGAWAKIVDNKLVINGVYQISDTGNLLSKLGMTPQNENFEYTNINSKRYPTDSTAVFRVGKGEISVDNFKVAYDGNADSLQDVVQRINDLKIGVLAEVNSQNRIVIRGTAATDFKISQLADSGNLLERLGVLTASTTLESTVPLQNSGTDFGLTDVFMDSLGNNVQRGAVGEGMLVINGVDIISGTMADTPVGQVDDASYNGKTVNTLESIFGDPDDPAGSPGMIAVLQSSGPAAVQAALAGLGWRLTEDNRVIIEGVSSWQDTGDFTQALRIVPRSREYAVGDLTTEDYITGIIERPPVNNFAFSIDVSDDVKNDLRKIAAALGLDQDRDGVGDTTQGPGNGNNALRMSTLKDARIMSNNTATMDDYFGGLIATLGSEASLASVNKETQLDVLSNIDLLNKSISGVSLDEEMVNLMKYQRGFQASARVLSTADKMLETLFGL